MDYKRMTAPCGLDCFNCAVYLAGENEKIRAAISKRLNIPYEKAFCRGCRNENGIRSFRGITEPCQVYKCISKKGLSFCSECADFPCDNFQPYADRASEAPHNIKVYNLCLIKKMGLESWAENKAGNIRESYFKGEFKI